MVSGFLCNRIFIAVQIIVQFGKGCPAFCIGIVLVDALVVRLLDDDRITGKIVEFREHLLCHLGDAVLNKPGIFMRGNTTAGCLPYNISKVSD